MRILVFLMLWPTLVLAQPRTIVPESVVGFLEIDTNDNGRAERVLLTRDDMNNIDLFIMPDTPEKPLAYFQDFTAVNDDDLVLSLAENGAFDVMQTTRHGQGTTVFSQRISWVSGPEAGYYTTVVAVEFSPRDENGAAVSCMVDFVKGWLETATNGDEMRRVAVQLVPTTPGAALPVGWDDLCGG